MDMSRGYEIQPAPEGGFCVVAQSMQWGDKRATVAAFTSAADLISWLAEQHGLTASVAVPGGYLVTDELCKDEGCPNHGTDHICTGWIEWNGGERPVNRDAHVIVRFDTGGERAGFAGEFAWSKGHAVADIVAYRPVPSVVLSVDEPLSPSTLEAIHRAAKEIVTKTVREHDQRRS